MSRALVGTSFDCGFQSPAVAAPILRLFAKARGLSRPFLRGGQVRQAPFGRGYNGIVVQGLSPSPFSFFVFQSHSFT
jgi:hypothetical protein